jgi:hypothetical protein
MTNLEPKPAASAGAPRGWMRGRTFAAVLVAFALAPAAGAQGRADARFFGTYCQPSPQEFCKSIRFLPDPCVTLSGARISLDHLEVPAGGTVRGGGTFRLDGKPGALAVAGSVTGLGRARLAGTIPALGEENMRQQGSATLSSDGIELRASVQNRTVVLRKDACGNDAPVVTLAVPSGPAFAFGQPIFFDGRVVDEDTSFPLERMVFRSSRQSPMPGFLSAAGQTPGFVATGLVPGEHRVTLTVTDSGGLTGRASVRVTIVDRPPETPVIFLPAAGATLAAGAPVLLQGHAHDPDTGFLPDPSLAWSAQVVPGGPFVPIGGGHETTAVFADPADPVVIRLTATSTAGGGQSTAERTVRVVPGGGDAPPVVVIREPDRLTVGGSLVRSYAVTETAHFVASAFDSEDAIGDLDLRWTFIALTGLDGAPDPAPPVPNPDPVTGSLTADVDFPPGGTIFYRVVFEATDSAGQTTSDSIQIVVSSNILL